MVNIGLSVDVRKEIASKLQILLANEYVLLTKSYKFHWNVHGAHFGSLHELFQKGFEMIQIVIDDTAERLQQLGFSADATLVEFLKRSSIKEQPGKHQLAEEMIVELLADHEFLIIEVRALVDVTDKNYRDMGTNNFLADLLQKHEKYAWFLRAHLSK